MNCHRLCEVSYLGTTEQLELMEIHEQRHYAGCYWQPEVWSLFIRGTRLCAQLKAEM